MSKGERTKERMVTVAADLLRKKGFHATGMNEIVQKSGAPKGSVYFHFPGGKDELAVAALEQEGRAWREKLTGLLDPNKPDLVADFDTVIGALVAELEASAFANGCPLATVTLETAADHDALQAVSKAHFRAWEALVAERMQAAGVPAEAALAFATLTLCSVEGALILARAYRDVEPLRRVAGALKLAFSGALSTGLAPPKR